MSQPLLSILIPTVVGREAQYENLTRILHPQLKDYWPDNGVQIMYDKDNKEMTIGEKRGFLYSRASGLYSWQIDDDDSIAPNAIELILEAIKSNRDCITFQEHCSIDGVIFKSNHSYMYADWDGDGQKLLGDGFHFHRTPFMKSVIKTEIARSVPILHIRFGEDHQWAQALKPHLNSEVHISEDLYFYQHTSTDHNERYGIKEA